VIVTSLKKIADDMGPGKNVRMHGSTHPGRAQRVSALPLVNGGLRQTGHSAPRRSKGLAEGPPEARRQCP
jgi:hypothetical protein